MYNELLTSYFLLIAQFIETRLKLSGNHNNVYKGSKQYSVIKEPITVYFKVSKATLQKIEIGALA